MQKLKFQNVEYILESEASKEDYKQVKDIKPTVIFLNKINSSKAENYINALSNIGIFFYGEGTLNNVENKMNVTSSKFAAQIYPNLMNLLKFSKKH